MIEIVTALIGYWWVVLLLALMIGYKLVLRVFGVIIIPQDSVGVVDKKFVLIGSNRTLPDGRIVATLCGLGPTHARAEVLDGVFIGVRRSVWADVRFDEARFDAFHLYDMDFSLSCHRRGHAVGVAQDLHLLHASTGELDERWSIYADRFVRKHNLVVAPAHPNPTCGLILEDATRIAAMYDALNAA